MSRDFRIGHAFREKDGYGELILQVPQDHPAIPGVQPEIPNFSRSIVTYSPEEVLKFLQTRQGETAPVEIGPGSVRYYRFARITDSGNIELAPEHEKPFQTGVRQCGVKFRVNTSKANAPTIFCAVEISDSGRLTVREYDPGRK